MTPGGESRTRLHTWYFRPDPGTPPGDPGRRGESLERRSGRELVEQVLSRLTGVAPHQLRFRTGEHGKPAIDQPAEARDLHFSLSHTRGLVVCSAAWHREVGVDAERIRRDDGLLDVVDQCFTEAEAAALRALPEAERCLRFLEHWTLKEAYAKARGLGLTLPLDQVGFEIPGAAGGIRGVFAPALGDHPSRWRFALHHVGGDYVVATAVTVP